MPLSLFSPRLPPQQGIGGTGSFNTVGTDTSQNRMCLLSFCCRGKAEVQKPLHIWLPSDKVPSMFLLTIWPQPQDSAWPFALQRVQCSCGQDDNSQCSRMWTKGLELTKIQPQSCIQKLKSKALPNSGFTPINWLNSPVTFTYSVHLHPISPECPSGCTDTREAHLWQCSQPWSHCGQCPHLPLGPRQQELVRNASGSHVHPGQQERHFVSHSLALQMPRSWPLLQHFPHLAGKPPV